MLTLLSLGFLIGLAHAFEADHITAVSSLVSGQSQPRRMMRLGAIWGIGHTATLMLVGGGVLVLGSSIPERVSAGLEGVVGLMLVLLGAHVLWRLRRDRVHFHLHRHGDGTEHLHLHSHRDETRPHDPTAHRHRHPDPIATRTLAVGVMHGMAGSAAIVLMSAASMASPVTGLFYILLFGFGSILGMVAVTCAIAFPLRWTAHLMTRGNAALQFLIGTMTVGVGILSLAESVAVLAP